MWNVKKRDWKRKLVGTFGIKMKCQDCNELLPEDSKHDRKYCYSCVGKRVKLNHHKWYINKKTKL